MNCQDFPNELFEFVEGSLPLRHRRAAEEHLASCPACRLQLQQEQQMAQALAREFQHLTAELTLPADFSERLLATRHPSAPEKTVLLRDAVHALWLRLLWPVTMTACVILVCLRAGHLYPGGPRPVQPSADPAVMVDLSSRLPTWKFHQEGNRVVDTLSYETVVASGPRPPARPETLRQKTESNL